MLRMAACRTIDKWGNSGAGPIEGADFFYSLTGKIAAIELKRWSQRHGFK